MPKFQIPLNGSNFVNKDREQAFQEAINDEYQIASVKQTSEPSSGGESTRSKPEVMEKKRSASVQKNEVDSAPISSNSVPDFLGQALNHTYAHQARTMEIHQQYLTQQAESIQLITAVLNQQGKALENGSSQAQIIDTFQRTLDNFHNLRVQGLSVHQEFLVQQADFSGRYLSFLEKNDKPLLRVQPAQEPEPSNQPAEWVVHVPPIVLDDQAAPEEKETVIGNELDTSNKMSLPAVSNSPAVTSEVLSPALLQIVAEKTGYPPEMLELNMDLEADLGIDSIKRVEILGALEDKFPSLPAANTEVLAQTRTLQEIVDYMENETAGSSTPELSVETVKEPGLTPDTSIIEPVQSYDQSIDEGGPVPSGKDLIPILLEIVAEKTGYPVEMLEPDMDMEADLGIDSIKRVEILGVMEEKVPGLPPVEAERLAELRTLKQIAELMSDSDQPSSEADVAVESEKKKVNPSGIQSNPVNLVSLPAPDRLELTIPKDNPLIITNDGTEFTNHVANSLRKKGWKIAIWDYPESLITTVQGPPSKDFNHVLQKDVGKDAIESTLEALRKEFGQPAGFIHLHPTYHLTSSENGLFSDQESTLIKQIFLIAGSVKSDLENLEPGIRKAFLAVTRTDGRLGFGSTSTFQEGNGLTGLIKSLSWEWPDVFCRAIDLDQEIDHSTASDLIIQEIYDPDKGLLEIGLGKTDRITIIRETH